MQDGDVTIPEAANIFGIPRWRLYGMVRDGVIWPVAAYRGKGCKGRVAYYRLSEIAARLADQHEDRQHAEPGSSPN